MTDFIEDTYNTIANVSEEVLFKEKNSKFFATAYPVTNEEQVQEALTELKKKHTSAKHFCYAYQIGTETKAYRVNDDGEPNNSAGMPIYGQLLSFDVTDVLVVVIRYFGGVKLGVGGLISAYKTATQMALENAEIIEKTIDIHFLITFEYKNLNNVMRLIKEQNLIIIRQDLELSCAIEIAIRKSNEVKIKTLFKPLFEVKLKKLN